MDSARTQLATKMSEKVTTIKQIVGACHVLVETVAATDLLYQVVTNFTNVNF